MWVLVDPSTTRSFSPCRNLRRPTFKPFLDEPSPNTLDRRRPTADRSSDLRNRPERSAIALVRFQNDLSVFEPTHVGLALGEKRFDFRTFARLQRHPAPLPYGRPPCREPLVKKRRWRHFKADGTLGRILVARFRFSFNLIHPNVDEDARRAPTRFRWSSRRTTWFQPSRVW